MPERPDLVAARSPLDRCLFPIGDEPDCVGARAGASLPRPAGASLPRRSPRPHQLLLVDSSVFSTDGGPDHVQDEEIGRSEEAARHFDASDPARHVEPPPFVLGEPRRVPARQRAVRYDDRSPWRRDLSAVSVPAEVEVRTIERGAQQTIGAMTENDAKVGGTDTAK